MLLLVFHPKNTWTNYVASKFIDCKKPLAPAHRLIKVAFAKWETVSPKDKWLHLWKTNFVSFNRCHVDETHTIIKRENKYSHFHLHSVECASSLRSSVNNARKGHHYGKIQLINTLPAQKQMNYIDTKNNCFHHITSIETIWNGAEIQYSRWNVHTKPNALIFEASKLRYKWIQCNC